ncbi:MAG: 50S ribosomal protein L29 [Deltaproteobacteria bacterium]|nr:50S ribosomal protein L29 [Deltaproteobacteria bacterium]MBW2076656.1 50S ribosomal protein L29 [Deltaproteobacteria bacterium]MBW2310109.1 50S ribosomal protein L29 [Deltaproteobacteria bacterium]RLB28983.1 MAG: 50S ribosomal protein L29 [Deltaproteobacteria bacterium]
MKPEELRELGIRELLEREGELARELFNLRFQLATGQLSNHTALKKTKRDIARVKTVLKELSARGEAEG